MKKTICIYLSLLFACSLFGQAKSDRHVILITIDGFRPDFYLEDQWETPTLHQLVTEGTHAQGVNSVFPSMTYPSHTTIVTGVQPATHGIYFNGLFEPDTLQGKIYWNFNQIKAPTLWQAVSDAGMKGTSLNWPVSAEAPVLFNIPDIGGRQTEVAKYAYPAGIIDSLNADIFHGKGLMNLSKDQNSALIAAWAIRKYKPNFFTIHLFSVDHAEHLTGRNGDMTHDAIADADESVAIIRKAIREAGIADNTLLIVTGDHGLLDVSTQVEPNVWLAKAGLLDNPNGRWKARFNSVGGSTFLYLKDKNDRQTLTRVKKILQDLPAEEKKYLRVITPAEARKIGANPEAALMLSALQGASFGNDYQGKAIQPGKGGTHGFYPDFQQIRTGFICLGPGVKHGEMIPEMNLRDITTITAHFLGLKMPTAKGKIPAGLFITWN